MQQRIPFRHRLENGDDIHVLMRFLVHSVQPGLPGDCHQGGPIHIGIRHTGDEVHRPRTEGSEADTGFTGKAAVDICHEGRAAFIARLNKLDVGFQERIH